MWNDIGTMPCDTASKEGCIMAQPRRAAVARSMLLRIWIERSGDPPPPAVGLSVESPVGDRRTFDSVEGLARYLNDVIETIAVDAAEADERRIQE